MLEVFSDHGSCMQRAQEDLLTKHLPASSLEAPLDITQQLHLLAAHAAVLAGQDTYRRIAQHMKVMPVRPGIELGLSLLGLLSKMSDEALLVVGGHRAVGHDQRGMEIAVVDRLKGIDIELGGAVDQVVHRLANGLIGVGR